MYGYPLKLKDIKSQWGLMFVYPISNYPYYSTNWYQALFESNDINHSYSQEEIGNVFFSKYGNREIIIDDEIMDIDYNNETEYKTAVAHFCGEQLGNLYLQNWRKYESYWNALIDKEYNPIWNVDGTEIRGFTRKNTGTQGNVTTKTGNITDNKTITYSGAESVANTGTDTNVESGSITDTKSGSRTNAKNGQRTLADTGTDTTTRTGNETKSTVPMESTNFYDTEKNTYNNVADSVVHGKTETETYTNMTDTETFNAYTDTETFNAHTNQRTLNTAETKTFNNRFDTDNETTTFNNVTDNGTRTDNLQERYDETLTRQGNIGVTKSQDLVESEILLRAKYDLMQIIQSDIANYILYMC